MKSNQERSNECLPPKKREIPASKLLPPEKPVAVAPAGESQRGENLAWLASVAGGLEGGRQHAGTPAEADGPQKKPHSVSPSCQSRTPPGPGAAAYSPATSQPGGTIQYAQLQAGLHLIAPPYVTPYASYVPSQLISPTTASTQQRPLVDCYVKADPLGQHPPSGSPLPPPSSQYLQLAGSPQAIPSSQGPSPLHLHAHPAAPQALALGAASQVVVQYADGPTGKKEDGQPREVLNGELEKGRGYSLLSGAVLSKQGGVAKGSLGQQQQQQETRHLVLPADYTQDSPGFRASLMLLPNSHTSADLGRGPEKPSSADKGGLYLGRPVSRTLSSGLGFLPPSPDLKAPVAAMSPHTVIQTTPSTAEQLSMGLPSSGFFPATAQPPVIGYIAGGGQSQLAGYHANLPQHLLIPGGQPIIIPVGGSRGAGPEEGHASVTTSQQFTHASPHAIVATVPPKCEPLEASGVYQAAPLQLPPLPPAASLPPYFVKGSIIQLADGTLKRVEDLKTEDFIQSAEISSELKIDSSTVERIDGSQAPNFAIIQFAVGEQRTQVSVEVLLEYPFFVFGQGWSSCCPERTSQLLELPCTKLSVGDVCVSLTLKNLRNGSLKNAQELDGVGLLFKPPKAAGLHGDWGGCPSERENGLGQQTGAENVSSSSIPSSTSANRDLKFDGKAVDGPTTPRMEATGGTIRPISRKRRWSAPESRKVEKTESECPSTPPKTSFIPQEVKISIEGRSNMGK